MNDIISQTKGLKIKSIRESNKPLVKRSLEYPHLNNYNKISSIMKAGMTACSIAVLYE